MLAVVASDTASAYVLVTGRVQGVGYRWFARSHATALGLRGWARNRRDGAVELEVIGTRGSIDRFVAELREGPPASAVGDVTVHWLPTSAGPSGFEIRPTL